jgi:mRNA-degrading endonuclease toxin of MazEF toxin-antitoxin module
VLCEQTRSIDTQRIESVIGTLSAAELSSVDDAIEIVLEL